LQIPLFYLEEYAITDLAKQLIEIIKLEKIQDFHFIGHAIGGFIGAELAVLIRTSENNLLSLTCINSWNELDPHTPKMF